MKGAIRRRISVSLKGACIMRHLLSCLILTALLPGAATAAVSDLASRGYALLPEPRNVKLGASDFRFGPEWSLEKNKVSASDIAVSSLVEGLKSRFHLPGARGGVGASRITLSIAPGSVSIGEALDSDRTAIAAQAYRLELATGRIGISANAAPGLFYGVQTLLQLIAPQADGSLHLPEGQIVDWAGLRLCRFSGKWRRRSPSKVKERTHEEATEALHAGRKGRHPEAAFAGKGANLEALR